MSGTSVIQITNLSKKYRLNDGEILALKDVSIEIRQGSFVTIVGKSGCGKTTLLRILSGLEERTGGDLSSSAAGENSAKPKISIVFQEPRLMPWLTVKQNMAFSLRGEKDSKRAETIVDKYLETVGLTAFKDAYPAQISGGMAQRTALGRTLCYEPDIILMDEPLSALDAYNRRLLQDELIRIFQTLKKTILFVTHDIDEAIYLGQKLIVMDRGRIISEVEIDAPYPRQSAASQLTSLRESVLLTLNTVRQ